MTKPEELSRLNERLNQLLREIETYKQRPNYSDQVVANKYEDMAMTAGRCMELANELGSPRLAAAYKESTILAKYSADLWRTARVVTP